MRYINLQYVKELLCHRCGQPRNSPAALENWAVVQPSEVKVIQERGNIRFITWKETGWRILLRSPERIPASTCTTWVFSFLAVMLQAMIDFPDQLVVQESYGITVSFPYNRTV